MKFEATIDDNGNFDFLDLDEKTLREVSQIFKALGEPSRIRILNLLTFGEFPVTEIAKKLSLTQSNVSHQLRLLKNLRLVKSRREGKTIFYSKDDDHVLDLLKQAIEHTKHD